jgi:prepilin peptidase CpaA
MPVSPEVWVAGGVGLAAMTEDLVRRRVSNWIPVTALAGGLVCQIAAHGWYGALAALAGAICGFLVFLIFYWLGGMGGGDVKLMAGFGALLGAGRLFEAALWTAGIGGLIAAGVIAVHAIRRRGRNAGEQEHQWIPYAPAITLGAWLAMVPK